MTPERIISILSARSSNSLLALAQAISGKP
jgi:hypothetical protein